MGLGKTITCVSLLASTLASAQAFGNEPLELPPPPHEEAPEDLLTADHFAGSVWGLAPPQQTQQPSLSAKAKAKQTRENEKANADYTRACRIKVKSRATLIICPLSTVVNWEDQFKEHWKGPVTVVGGGGGGCTQPAAASSAPTTASTPAPIKAEPAFVASGNSLPHTSQILKTIDTKLESPPAVQHVREGPPLRVYVYHGNSRKPDPTFLADFDAVITTYSTLATEYSKQCKSSQSGGHGGDEEEEDGASSDGIAEVDEKGNPVAKLKPKKNGVKKRKKAQGSNGECTSALQSVHWFRVVLDEAQYVSLAPR